MGNVNAMANLMKKLTDLANSPQGKKLVDKAQQFANDPKTKEHVDKAKTKLAEMRSGGSTGGTTGPTAGGAPHKDDTPGGPPPAA